MRRFVICTAILFCVICFPAKTYAVSGGGFVPSRPLQATAESVKSLPEDAYVRLRGYIVERLDPLHYTLRDATGDIGVEIERSKWSDIEVTAMDLIEIDARVEKIWYSTRLEVLKVKKIATGSVPGVGKFSYTPVAQIQNLPGGMPVVVRGALQSKVHGDLYVFKDATGDIAVTVPQERWCGMTVMAGERLEIWGVVDRSRDEVRIDVGGIVKVDRVQAQQPKDQTKTRPRLKRNSVRGGRYGLRLVRAQQNANRAPY